MSRPAMTSAHSILIVDDDHSGRTMLALILRQSGYKIRTAPGGVEALKILQHESFEWMITDARMLPVNGFDLSREAKRLRPNMRVLMVSAVSTETDILGYPIEQVFPKPIPVEKLLECLSGAG